MLVILMMINVVHGLEYSDDNEKRSKVEYYQDKYSLDDYWWGKYVVDEFVGGDAVDDCSKWERVVVEH